MGKIVRMAHGKVWNHDRLSLSDFRNKSVRSESEAVQLKHNDEIKISDTILLFQVHDQ